ncbi:MAG TPA: assimilatory sulfite reductase (NADPH) flavoprotein subunit [Saprospiraceae bacterium]|nr:assimilatory sulfite reductase (NADPH) flavoprotein subunit [Saprospiraceae bacterium]
MTATLPQPPAGFDEDLLNKLTTQHNSMQQMWLSGYLYGVALHGHIAPSNGASVDLLPAAAIASAASPALPKVTILYGSQTGNSKKVANQVAARVRERGWEVGVADLNDYPTKNLKGEKIALFVVSTQGEGDPPVSAEEFHKWLLGPRAPKLDGLQFAVCGLGDKNYLKFCQTGKEVDARLEELGAIRLAERADCDVDYEDVVESWAITVLEKMSAIHVPAPLGADTPNLLVKSNGVHVSLSTAAEAAGTDYDRKRPFAAPVLEKIKLNGRGSQKETWHFELSLEDSGLVYEPGDSLGVYPKNAESLVREVLYSAMLNGNKILNFNGKDAPFREILFEVELSVLTRETVEKYAAWTNNAKLKILLDDTAALKKFLWGRNVADLLREFPAAMSEATLLGFLRKMPPRLYSIASSPAAHTGEVHLTVAAVRYDFNGRPHHGVASTFLADRIATGATAPVFVEHNEYFKLPVDDSADIIMVGPGTGVAPFRAFVEERSERGGSGKNWLFFGNPYFETDFLYQTEWLNHLKRGTLDRLDVAFSRDQEQKFYVQHRLAERSKLIFERLENGAYFYVCGDKERMASDVQNAVLQIIEKESGRDEVFAEQYLKGLKKQRRYLEDVY